MAKVPLKTEGPFYFAKYFILNGREGIMKHIVD